MEQKLLRITLMLLFIFSLLGANMNIIRISRAQDTHDVAVTNVAPSRTLVKSGEAVNITVAVQNQGEESETFSVTLYRDITIIEIKTVTNLAAGQNATLVFTWNTIDTIEEIYALTTKEKTYSIKAEATLVVDADPGDNTFTSSSKIKVISQYIAVRPEQTVNPTLTKDKNYTVTIYTDYNGTDVWGWNILLTFSPAILECVEVRNGDLITKTKDPSAEFLPVKINNTIGELSAGAFFFYLPPDIPPTTFGPGTFANVTFKVVGTGYSNITLLGSNTYLMGYNPIIDPDDPYDIITEGKPLNHIVSGYFSNAVTQIIDIAVISVEPASTLVTQGDLVNITVVIKNQGASDQTFDVKVYYDYMPDFPGQNIIGTKTMQSLAAGANQTFIFTWNTTYVKEGTYIITARVSRVQGDVDPKNDQKNSSKTVTVKLEELRPLPITEIIIGVVIIIAVIAAIYFVQKMRRKKPQIE